MKTVTVRDLRQRWPSIEKLLVDAIEPIMVTRHGHPVAQLVRLVPPTKPRRRFDPAEHIQWLQKVWGDATPPTSSEQMIERERADRRL